VNPQGAAVNEYLYPVSQSIDETHRGVEIETDQVDDSVTTQLRDRFSEGASALGSATIECYALDRLPFGRVVIRSSRPARNSHDLMALVYQTRHQPSADMSRRSDD